MAAEEVGVGALGTATWLEQQPLQLLVQELPLLQHRRRAQVHVLAVAAI